MNSVFLENLNFKKKVETDLKVRIGGGDCEGSLAESISRISLMLSGRFDDQDRYREETFEKILINGYD